MFRRSIVGVLGVLCLCLASPQVRAQTSELEDVTAGKGLFHAEGAFFGRDLGGVATFLFSPRFEVWIPVAANWSMSVDLGFVYVNLSTDLSDDSSSTLRVGNPTIGAHYRHDMGSSRLRVGVVFAIPVASIPEVDSLDDLEDVLLAAAAYGVGASMRGLWDAWLWLPETLTLGGPIAYEVELEGPLVIGADGALALVVPIGDNTGSAELLLQAGGSLGFEIGTTVLGMKLTGVWLVTAEGDNFQLAMEPFLRASITERGFLEARLTMNLDDPAGFAFEDDGIYGVHVGGGMSF